MESSRFIGVGIFFVIGILLGAFGIGMASYYQRQASENLLHSKRQFAEAKKRYIPALKKIAEDKKRVSSIEQKSLNIREKKWGSEWRKIVEDRQRVEREYHSKWLPNRNYAMMIAVLGFAFMVWGLFRVLQD